MAERPSRCLLQQPAKVKGGLEPARGRWSKSANFGIGLTRTWYVNFGGKKPEHKKLPPLRLGVREKGGSEKADEGRRGKNRECAG